MAMSRRSPRRRSSASVVLGLVALTACASDGHRAGAGPIPEAVIGRPFTVVSVDGVAVNHVSFQLNADGLIDGEDGCNGYSSSYLWTPRNNGIDVDPVASRPRVQTAVGCPGFKVVGEPYGRFEVDTSTDDHHIRLTIHRDDGRLEIATAPQR